MKKQYINPKIRYIFVENQNYLMADSTITMELGSEEVEVDDDTEGFVQYSKGTSFWDDEE